MIDVAQDFKDRFSFGVYWFYDKAEKFNDFKLTDEEAKAADVLRNLHDTVDAIPPSLIRSAESIYGSFEPEKLEDLLVSAVQQIGFRIFPKDATEFLETLNQSLQVLERS